MNNYNDDTSKTGGLVKISFIDYALAGLAALAVAGGLVRLISDNLSKRIDYISLVYLAAAAAFLLARTISKFSYDKLTIELGQQVERLNRRVETIGDQTSEQLIGIGGVKGGVESNTVNVHNSEATIDTRAASNRDPNDGRFGGKPFADDRLLSATVEDLPGRSGYYRISLTVRSTDASKPLTAPVTFYLHPTFRRREITVVPKDDTAKLTLIAYGAFTVGAMADQGTTHLELNLANVPEAPDSFRYR